MLKVDRALNQVMEYAMKLEDEEFERIVITPAKDNFYKLIETEKESPDSIQNFIFVKVGKDSENGSVNEAKE
jgi:hypothetical protein